MIEYITLFFSEHILTMLDKSIFCVFLSIVLLLTHSINFKFLFNRSTIFLTLMLPLLIMLITQTIASNLYLSLGLIGALSIVRYRTPVKNQYELVFIFALIAIGIICGVNPQYAFGLTMGLSFIPLIFKLVTKLWPNISKEDFRFNSQGKIELNLVASIKHKDFLNELNISDTRLLRLDLNYQNKEFYALFVFDSYKLANSFINNLNFKPLSISMSDL